MFAIPNYLARPPTLGVPASAGGTLGLSGAGPPEGGTPNSIGNQNYRRRRNFNETA